MDKQKKECEECFSEIKEESKKLFSEIALQHSDFLTKMETKHRDLTIVNMSILGMFGLAIAYIFAVQLTKASKNETLSIKQAEQLEQTMTKYFDQRFVKVDGSVIDESTYKWHIETILTNNSRSAKRIPFNNEYEPFKSEKNNKN